MRRMWAADAAIVVCLALGGIPVLAQEASPPAALPAAAATTPLALDCVQTADGVAGAQGSMGTISGVQLTCDLTAEDARLSGEMTMSVECDWADPATEYLGAACWAPWEIVGADGAWSGSIISVEPTWGGGSAVLTWVGQGTGAYAGWTVVAYSIGEKSGDLTQDGWALIYQGPLPRWPALPSSVGE